MKKTLTFLFAVAMGAAFVHAQAPTSDVTPATDQVAQTIEWTEAVPVDVSQTMEIEDASFPAEQNVQTLLDEFVEHPDQTTAAILNILLGDFGVGHFYTGQTLRGVLDIIFCWTGIPAVVGIVEGIIWLCDDDAGWEARVARWQR